MDSFISFYNILSSLGALLMLALAIVIFATLFINRKSELLSWIKKNILLLGFIVTLTALVGSLIYSNVIGYPPCMFCWYARIFIYPQVLLYGMALYIKDFSIIRYTWILTLVGFVFGAYHYITELIQYSPLPCSASGVSCLTRYVYQWNFVTIPFMVLSVYVLLIALLTASKMARSSDNSFPQQAVA